MKQLTTYLAIIAMLILACNTSANKNNNAAADQQELEMNAPPEKTSYQHTDKPVTTEQNSEQPVLKPEPTHDDWDKKIIKTAEVSLELQDYAVYDQNLHKSLKSFGAYIASEEQQTGDKRTTNTIVIKVPVEQFENLINSFAGDGVKVLQKKISTEDVSGRIVDTKSRLEAKKQMRDKYIGMLKQAKNMKEIVEVQREINAIQEDIESASGRVNFLGHQSAYSTVHLQYFQSQVSSTNQDPTAYLDKLKKGFMIGITIIGGLLVFVVSLWPLIIMLGIAAFIWKKRKAKAVRL